jgi:hypothetical protein
MRDWAGVEEEEEALAAAQAQAALATGKGGVCDEDDKQPRVLQVGGCNSSVGNMLGLWQCQCCMELARVGCSLWHALPGVFCAPRPDGQQQSKLCLKAPTDKGCMHACPIMMFPRLLA